MPVTPGGTIFAHLLERQEGIDGYDCNPCLKSTREPMAGSCAPPMLVRESRPKTPPATLFRGKIFQCAHPGEIFIDIYQYHMHSITNTRTSVQCTSCCVQTGKTMAKSPPKGPSTPVRASPRPRDRTATGRAGGGWNERKCARPNDSDHKEYFHAPES